MFVGNTEITKESMPSYQIGREYPTRRYSFMQDTLSRALQKQQMMQKPQNGVEVSQQSAQQPNVWGGQQ